MTDQFILGPESPIGGVVQPDVYPLPKSVIKIGRMLDTSNMLPGDLILSSPVEKDAFYWLINKAQLDGGFNQAHACWTHASVYVGRDYMVEARFKDGVSYNPVHRFEMDYLLRVRRNPDKSEKRRCILAIQAMTRINDRYSYSSIPEIAMASKKGFFETNKSRDLKLSQDSLEKCVICSQVYQHAHLEAYRGQSATAKLPFITMPADLSASPILKDIEVSWLTVE